MRRASRSRPVSASATSDTTPLKGLFSRAKGGFYHDGRFASLGAVVDHYDRALQLALNPAEKADLVEFLKSL